MFLCHCKSVWRYRQNCSNKINDVKEFFFPGKTKYIDKQNFTNIEKEKLQTKQIKGGGQ